jgi:uncharacterized repeat protein (TIGR01451 family)
MRPTPLRPTLAAALGCLLLLAAALLPPARPAPAAGPSVGGAAFGSAVPCLDAEATFATTCFADTIFHSAPAGDPALVQLSLSAKAPLAALGARASTAGGPAPTNARVANGIGSIYGLAYDDGAASGVRRLFAAAYTRRFTSFGPGGAGAVYAYDFATGSWGGRPIITVPDAGWERTVRADQFDADAIAHVGRSGLGDIEISPDGRELFVVNIAARRIERYDLTASPPARRAPIAIDDGVPDADDALDAVWAQYRGAAWYSERQERGARADTVPFALEFSPLATPDGPALVLGLTDTMGRAVAEDGAAAPSGYPAVHVVTYALNGTQAQRWSWSLSQPLDAPGIGDRMDGSFISDLWRSNDLPSSRRPYSGRGLRGWNPWHNNLAAMPGTSLVGLGATIFYPQPLLADIEFSDGGRRMFLALRDRTGDQVMAAEAPPGQFTAIAQGDTLAYRLSGGAWALQSPGRPSDPVNLRAAAEAVRPAPSDFFNDNLHSFAPQSAPAHIENHGGALATLPLRPGGPDELLATTRLFGERESGVGFYSHDGGRWISNRLALVTASPYAGGKAATLGDLEALCTYAFVTGRVWDDRDGDGRQDSGEPPLANVRLELFFGHPASPSAAAALTDDQGRYRFAVPPNTALRIRVAAGEFAPGTGRLFGYRLAPGNAPGVEDTLDSDAAQLWGYVEFAGSRAAPFAGDTGQALVTPTREQELTHVDLGLTSLPAAAAIGDRVWVDGDGDGIQDAGEAGLPLAELRGMQVALQPSPDIALSITSPAVEWTGDGGYLFRNVPPGIYRVVFAGVPPGYAVSPHRAGGGANDTADSDVEPAGLATRYVVVGDPPPLGPGGTTTLDLGLTPNLTDVAVELAATPSALVGQPVDYTVTARNLSAAGAAHDVVLEHDLPPGATLLSAGGSPARQGQRLTWSLGTLPPGQSQRFTVRVSAPATLEPPAPARQLVSEARVRTSSRESAAANNLAQAATALVRPELAVSKAGPAAALVGDELIYTLSYGNRGSAAASEVTLSDELPVGVIFTRFVANPGGACGYVAAAHRVMCALGALPAGASGSVQFAGRLDPAVPSDSLVNTAVIAGATPGDAPGDNSAAVTTAVLRPNPGVSLNITPKFVPFGKGGAIAVTYGNGLRGPASGEARDVVLTVQLSTPEVVVRDLPAGCRYSAAATQVRCELGTLAPGARRTIDLFFMLTFAAPDRFTVTADIATTTPERSADLADNAASLGASVVRPNVFVDASGPGSIVGRGSVFWYSVEYGNLHRQGRALTAPAEDVVLTVRLPAKVELVEASVAPSVQDSESGTLIWNLRTLPPGGRGRIVLVVRTAVDAGAQLRLDAAISTSSLGDDPADNADTVLTEVVQPPSEIPRAAGDLRLALRSELDPNSQDRRPDNGVYLSAGAGFSWPAGETLDFTPRLVRLSIPDEAALPFPYAYRARVVGWSLRSVTVNGQTFSPTEGDSRSRSGCRPGAVPAARPALLEGCAYGYLDGGSIEAIRRAALPDESQMRGQARIYWTQPPAPDVPSEVYLYAAEPLTAARLEVQVEVELQIVNAAPGEIGGVPLPEVPVVPLPDPQRQLVSEVFEVTLLVPRSIVGPGTP